MQKPVKPIKPSKKSPAPSKIILKEYDDRDYLFQESFKYSDLTKIKEDLCVDDLYLEVCADYYVIVSYGIKNPNYLRDLEIYNNRFNQYEEDLKKYNEDMVIYKKFALEQSKKRLEAQIRRLSKLP